MAAAALARPDGRFLDGVVVSADAVAEPDPRLDYIIGGHPVPTAGSEAGGPAGAGLR